MERLTKECLARQVEAARFPAPWQVFDACAQAFRPAFLWRSRGEEEIWLALGAARTFATLAECRAALRAADAGAGCSGVPARCFALFAFDPESPLSAPWEDFAPKLIVQPRVLLRWGGGEVRICSGSAEDDAELRACVQQARDAPQARPVAPPQLSGRSFSPAAWSAAVERLKAEIATGRVSKAVLVRKDVWEGVAAFRAGEILARLGVERESYLFAHCMRESIFLGLSPECLFRLEGEEVQVDSLAGTRPRGADAEHDARLASELRLSEKDRAEQQIVTGFVTGCLAPLSERITTDAAPQVRKLATVQHLFTSVRATIRRHVTLDDLLRALHPTPAVCGMPREQARAVLAALEDVPRGLFAGALGWVESGGAEFAVAIRSALLARGAAHVFAGAGIVRDSNAETEWRETEWKMRPMLEALGCGTT